jgi:hypothetical protein
MFVGSKDAEFGFTTAKHLVEHAQPRPSFWSETLPAYFSENNILVNSYRFYRDTSIVGRSPLPAKDFEPLTKETVQGIPENFWGYLAQSVNEKDLEVRRNKIIREIKDLDIRKRSSGWASFGAGLLEMWFDPTTYIPFGKTVRYPGLLEGVAKNAIHAAPVAFGGAALSNAVTMATKESKGLEDWMVETFTQGVLGSSVAGLAGGTKAGQYLLARIGIKARHADLELKAIIAPETTKKYKKGEIIDIVAAPSKDLSTIIKNKTTSQGNTTIKDNNITNKTTHEISASNETAGTATPSQQRRLKESIDEQIKKGTLSTEELVTTKAAEINKLIKDGIATVGENAVFRFLYKPAPIVKGLTSPFAIFRKFTNGIFDHNLLLGKMEHLKLNEINTKIQAAKKLIKESTTPEEKLKIEEELIRLKEEKKAIKTEKYDATYAGTPEQEFSAQTIAAKYMTANYFCEVQAMEIWKESVGLGGPISSKVPFAQTAIDVLKKISKEHENQISFKTCLEDATYSLRRGEESTNPVAQKIAQLYRKHLYDPIMKDLQELGSLPENLTIDTAISYVNRLYDKEKIRAKENDFIALLETFYIARDNKVKELLAPIEIAERQVKNLEGLLKQQTVYEKKLIKTKKDTAAIKKLRQQTIAAIEAKNKKLQGLKDTLQHQIDTGTLPLSTTDRQSGITQLSLLDGKPTITKALQEEHAALLKPLIESKDRLAKMREQWKLERSRVQPGEKVILEGSRVQPEIATNQHLKARKKYRKDIKKQKKLIAEIQEGIQQKIEKGEVSKELYYKGKKTGKKYLYNLQKRSLASLAKKVADYEHLARCITETIIDENSQQMAARIFNGISGKGNSKPSALKARTVLCADHILEKYLINDITEVASAHAGNLSNYIALENFFRRNGTDASGAKKYFIRELKTEYKKAKDLLYRQPDSPNRAKKLHNLQKEFNEAKEGMEEFLDVFRGDYERPKTKNGKDIQGTINILKQYAYSTMMGAVALMFQTDIVMPIFKHGFKHIADGVIPTIGQMLSTKAPKRVWADMAVGINTTLATLRKCIRNEGSQWFGMQPATRLFNNISKVGSNLFFINQLYDVAENMAASTSASALLRDIHNWTSKGHFIMRVDANGIRKKHWISDYKFSKKDLERLQLGRLDLQEHGHAIQEMFEKFGDKTDFMGTTGYIPNTVAWTNTKAAEHFRMFIRREVDHLINKPNKADNPFWFKHPALSLTTQFLSWSFGVTNNITIPMMQRMDQEKLTWMVLSMSLGSLTGPMRQLANGQEVDLNPITLLGEGITQSGVLGWQWEQLIKLNSVLDLEQIRFLQSDRFRRKTLTDLALGPIGSIYDSVGRVASMFLNGEINKEDFRKVIRLAPFTNAFYLRRLLNDWVESLSIPNKPPKKYYGENAEPIVNW